MSFRQVTVQKTTTTASLVAVGVGFAYLVAHDGTPVWQLGRLLAVVAVTVLAWIVINRVRGDVGAVTAMGIGAVAVATGLGILVPRLDGPTFVSLVTVAGLLALVGGLVLFVFGALSLFRGRPRWVRIVAWAAGVTAVLILCWTLGQAVAATNVPASEVGQGTPSDLGLAYRDVELATSDGVRLSGWYLPSRNGAAVALSHGAGSTRSGVMAQAAVLARHGYGVLMFDARGHGWSDGRAMDFGWFGDLDIGAAVGFLQRQPDVDPGRIGAVGLSMGGEESIGASAGVDGVRAVVAEGATGRVAGDKAWLSDEFGFRGAVTERVEAMTYGLTDLLTSAGPPVTLHEAVAYARTPTLLIAAGDVADEASAAGYVEAASPDTVEVWVAPGTGHTGALDAHPQEWESRVVGFLDRALGVPGAESR